MSEFLVDTDWIVDVLHGQPTAVQTLVDLASQGLAVSVISYGELYEGAYYNNRDAQAALTHDLTLLTRNLRDFLHVPSLKLYQPS